MFDVFLIEECTSIETLGSVSGDYWALGIKIYNVDSTSEMQTKSGIKKR